MSGNAKFPAVQDPELNRRLARLERIASTLDARFRLPGTQLRFGWDSIVGLVPGIGDLVTSVPAAYMIYEGARMGARKRTIARMTANSAIDLVVGGIPLLGDAFDLLFKSHKRNAALLTQEANRLERQRGKLRRISFAGSRAYVARD